jgi:PAS domain S-box-containing protein
MWKFARAPRLSMTMALTGAASTIVTAAALVGLVVWQSGRYNTLAQKEVDQLIEADLDHIAQGIYNLVETANETAQQQVDADLRAARKILENMGGFSQSREMVAWTCINQLTGDSARIRLPKALVGDIWLGQNARTSVETRAVDEIAQLVGESSTIFQIMNSNGDMIRVATTVTDRTGHRAIGTYISATNPDGTPNPVISAIVSGQTFHGLAYVVDSWYLTAYEGIRDRRGTLLGMLYVGIRQDSVVANVRQAFLSTTVGVTGYVYALGGKGAHRGTYIISQAGQRDGENVWDNTDSDNRFVIREIIAKAVALHPHELATELYRWQNLGESTPRWKTARLAYYEPWDWVIGTSVYLDELEQYKATLRTGRVRMTTTLTGAGLLIALLVGGLGALLAWTIIRPIRQMTAAVETIVEGNLDHVVDIHSRNEIGILARSFNVMTQRLKKTIEGLHHSEEKYKNIYNGALEGIFQTTFDGQFLSANPSMARLLGYDSPEDLIGSVRNLPAQLYVHKEDRDRLVSTLLDNGVALGHEVEMRLKDGRTRWISVSANAVPDETGTPHHIEGFVTDCSERKRAEEQVLASLKEKDLLLKEIHHRVKNNMQVISSLLNLQLMSLTDDTMKSVFTDSQNRIRSMALIHELLYFSGIFGAVDFLQYCNTLAHRLYTVYHRTDIQLHVEGDRLTLNLDQAIPCGLILNELVSNAMKHAFPPGRTGRIDIRIKEQDHYCHLTVSDDGVGLPVGFDMGRSQSVGMQLLMSLPKQIDGTLNISSGPGVTSTLTFPLAER